MAFLRNIMRWLKRLRFYVVLECITLGLIFVFLIMLKSGSIEFFFSTLIVELCLNHLWHYYVGVEEKFMLYSLKEKFNKEYFDLYWNSNLIRIRLLVVVEYVSLRIGTSLYNASSICSNVFYCLFYLFVGFFIWAIGISCFLQLKYNKELEKLFTQKKENFGPYTDEEEKILRNIK